MYISSEVAAMLRGRHGVGARGLPLLAWLVTIIVLNYFVSIAYNSICIMLCNLYIYIYM